MVPLRRRIEGFFSAPTGLLVLGSRAVMSTEQTNPSLQIHSDPLRKDSLTSLSSACV